MKRIKQRVPSYPNLVENSIEMDSSYPNLVENPIEVDSSYPNLVKKPIEVDSCCANIVQNEKTGFFQGIKNFFSNLFTSIASFFSPTKKADPIITLNTSEAFNGRGYRKLLTEDLPCNKRVEIEFI